MEKWAETLEKLQMEEEKIIAAESEPLRLYLMKYVFPTLTKGKKNLIYNCSPVWLYRSAEDNMYGYLYY